jgi:hypothetical protein
MSEDNVDNTLFERQIIRDVEKLFKEMDKVMSKTPDPVTITENFQEPILIIHMPLSETFDEAILKDNGINMTPDEFNNIIREMFGDMHDVKPRPKLQIVASNNEKVKSKSVAALRLVD